MSVPVDELAAHPDPYPHHADVRRKVIHRPDDGRWVVATAAEVEQILTEPQAVIGFRPTDRSGEIQARMARLSDYPEHERRRAIATSHLALLNLEQLQREAADLTAAAMGQTSSPGDVMSAVARVIPVAVLARALGASAKTTVEAATAMARTSLPPGRPRGGAEPYVRELWSLLRSTSFALDDGAVNVVALLFQTIDATLV